MGMEGLPAKGFERGLGFWRQKGHFGAKARPIGLIAHQRMADRGQMDTNLMSSAGFEPAGEEAGHRLGLFLGLSGLADAPRAGLAAITLENLPMGDRLAPALAHRHAVAGPRIAVDRSVDGAVRVLGRAPDESEIAALERFAAASVVGELR